MSIMEEYSLIKRRPNLGVKMKVTYQELLINRNNPVFLFQSLIRYYKSVYRRRYNTIDVRALIKTPYGQALVANGAHFEGINNSPIRITQIIDLEEHKELVDYLPRFRPSESRFIRNSPNPNRYPVVLMCEYDHTGEDTNRVVTRHSALIIDMIGIYKFKPHVYYSNNQTRFMAGKVDSHQGYVLGGLRDIIPTYKEVDIIRLLRMDNLYAGVRLLEDVAQYLIYHQNEDLPEEVQNSFATLIKDAVFNGITNRLTVQGMQAYNIIKKSDSTKMLYEDVLSIKANGNITVNMNHMKTVATKYQTKKGVNPGIQYLAGKSEFLKYGFSLVEYDNDVDRKRIQIVNNEFKALMDAHIVPSLTDLNLDHKYKFIIRFRKLGREHDYGLYCDELKTIIVDNACSLMHEYGHLIDFNYNINGNEDEPFSMSDSFKTVRDLYTDKLFGKADQSLDNNLVQKDLDYFLLPTEIFARSFEFFLDRSGVRGFFVGQTHDDKDKWHDKFMLDQSYNVCCEPDLSSAIMNYFNALLGNVSAQQLAVFNQVVKDFKPKQRTDLTGKLGTTSLDYQDMSKQERHMCVMAKKYIKNISLRRVDTLLTDTDALYDKGVNFPQDLRLVFYYNSETDRVDNARVIEKENLDLYKQQGFFVATTKSIIASEQHFYEVFSAQGVQQQLEYEKLKRNVQHMFQTE